MNPGNMQGMGGMPMGNHMGNPMANQMGNPMGNPMANPMGNSMGNMGGQMRNQMGGMMTPQAQQQMMEMRLRAQAHQQQQQQFQQRQAPGQMPPQQNPAVQNLIIGHLRQQPAIIGSWQQALPLKVRYNFVLQIYTQLHLLQSSTADDQGKIRIALNFESEVFRSSQTQATYEQTCKEKLQEITHSREKSAQQAEQSLQHLSNGGRMQQMGMANMQVPNGMPNMSQGQFQQQLQGQQTPGQMQQGQMRMLQQGQMPPNQGPMAMQMQNRLNMMQNGPARPGQPQGMPNGMPQQMNQAIAQFTPEENNMVGTMAARMAQMTPPQEIANIQHKLNSLPDMTKMQIKQSGVDPLIWYFRRQAQNRYLQTRRGQQAQQQQSGQPAHTFPIGQTPGNAAHNQFPGQSPNVGNANQMQQFGPGQGGPNGMNPQFLNIQQQAGMQQQSQGVPVVPASQPGQGPQQRPNLGTGMPQQSSTPMKGAQNQQQVPQQTQGGARMTPTQSQNPPMQRPPSAANLTGMPNGLHGPTGQNQPSPALPNINKAADIQRSHSQSSMQQRQGQNQNQTPQQNPAASVPQGSGNSGQPNANLNQSNQMRPNGSGPPRAITQQMLDSLPPQLKAQVMQQPPEKRNEFAWNMVKRITESRKRAGGMGQTPGQGSGSGNNQSTGGDASSAQNQANSQVKQQPGANGGQNSVPTSSTNVNQQGRPTNGTAAQSKQDTQNANTMLGLQAKMPMFSEHNIKEMDTKPFPPGMLNQQLRDVPQHVKTWGELKEWTQQNQSRIPATVPDNIKKLQIMYFSKLAEKSLSMKNAQMRQQSQQAQDTPSNGSQSTALQNQQGPAPQAPMGPVQAGAAPNFPIPQASPHEIQAIRKNIPQAAALKDEQISMMIYKKKMLNMVAARQAQALQMGQRPNAASAGAAGQIPNSNQTQNQNQATAQSTPPVPQKGQKQATDVQTGVKRQQSEDVVEVPPPTSIAQPGAQAPVQSSAAQQLQPPLNARMTIEKATTNFVEYLKRYPGFAQVDETKLRKVSSMRAKIIFSPAETQKVPTDPQTQQKMQQLCEELVPLTPRFDIVAPLFFCVLNRPEQDVLEVLQLQKRLLAQSKRYNMAKKENNITENTYMMTPADLEGGLRKMKDWFTIMANKGILSRGGQSQPGAPTASMPPVVGKAQQPQTKNATPRVAGKEQAPAAPTSEKPPPFPFDNRTGNGVPKYHERPNELTREGLRIPPKKRKMGDGSASPVQFTPPKATGPSATPAGPQIGSQTPFRCPVPNCSAGKQGFPSAEALQNHQETAHREEDPENPLEYCLENIRHCLNLDINGKLNQSKMATSQPMKQSLSAQGRTPGKLEGGTPMSRIATGNRSNLGAPRTPQEPGTVKSTGSDVTPSKGIKGKAGNAALTAEPLTPPPDLWVGVGMSPAELASHFPTPADIQSTLSLTSLTPASTLSSNKSEKNSPKPGNEVVEAAPVDVNISTSDWMPGTFFADAERDLDLNAMFAPDDTLTVEWDMMFPKEPPQMGRDGKPIKPKKYTVDDPKFNFDLFEGSM